MMKKLIAGMLASCLIFGSYAVMADDSTAESAESTATGTVELNWEEVSEADGYTVYRNDGSKWVALADLSDTQYVDTDAKSGKYAVFSYRLDGNDKIYGNYDYQGIEAGVK